MSFELTKGWTFKSRDGDEDWLPVASVPTNIHLDLLANDKIPDPFVGFNELKCEWVNEEAWSYRTTLPKPVKGTHVALAFDGLDTFATVKLNGEVILQTSNMFTPYRVEVADKIKYGMENVLQIDFDCAFKHAREIKNAHPEHEWVGFNGDMARLAVRKAQYHWGWDWGPVLCPCGPWKPVRLEVYRSRISDIRIEYELSSDYQTATGKLTVSTEGTTKEVTVDIRQAANMMFTSNLAVGKDGKATTTFVIDDVRLWWPHGYGSQPLYDVTANSASGDDDEVQTAHRRIGFRKAELVQEVDKIGKSFYFRINGVDVFCGGSDWIPADSFTPRISSERYRKWLQTMVDGYQVMIRVWGGGIYEDDIFYDICDELGILVWQDFMFGCGNYPAFPEMLDSIKEEATANLRRIRHHPSLVILAGNNEDYQVQESFGLQYKYDDKDPESWLKSNFPARYIYEKLLPEAVAAESPEITYHPGSPWGDGLITSNTTVGDMHQWNVWHGTQEKYQIFDTLGGRFNSEFGMEAFPHIETIKSFCHDPAELYPQSHTLDFHNKADGHERRIATYLVENFRTVVGLEGFIHLTQLSQAEALMFGYRGWRRQWGMQRQCGGALVWQLNDCWPVTSWSIIDYYLRKKPAYYAMRRVLAPVAVAVKREHHDWSVVHARPAKRSKWECWVASGKTTDMVADMEVRFVSVKTGEDLRPALKKHGVKITANGTTDIFDGVIDNESEEAHVLAARIFVDGEVVARDCDWPQPLKYLDLSDRMVEVKQDGTTITITAARPTKGVVFEEREGVLIEDSALDVVPGDQQIVKVEGMKEGDEPLRWRYLGM